jgi:hypothetical protein
MKNEAFTLEFITPCFAAGAEQGRAELRASEVRGKLRWWFRALGGTREQEAAVFGAVAGEKAGASAVQIRARVTQAGRPWSPPRVNPMSDSAYIWYFASVSGKHPGQRGPGPRWTPHGNLPPGTKFEIQVRQVHPIPADAARLYRFALEAFLLLGGLGLRVTRGLGAFVCDQRPADATAIESCRQVLVRNHFNWVAPHQDLGANWLSAINAAGTILRRQLRPIFPAGKNGDKTSPLGSSKPRQTDGTFVLVVFEAPAARVLGPRSREGAPACRVLQGS